MTDDTTTGRPPLVIDSWVDVLCAWCYLGAQRLDLAVARSPRADDIQIALHTFQLHPDAPRAVTSTMDYLARQFETTPARIATMESPAAEQLKLEGLPYTRNRPIANTHDVLRLIHLAIGYGVAPAYVRAVQHGIFSGNYGIFDTATLVSLGASLGIPAEEIRAVLQGDRYADAVTTDRANAVSLGATGVPFTLFANRFVMNGAATAAQYDSAIEQAWRHLLPPGLNGLSSPNPAVSRQPPR